MGMWNCRKCFSVPLLFYRISFGVLCRYLVLASLAAIFWIFLIECTGGILFLILSFCSLPEEINFHNVMNYKNNVLYFFIKFSIVIMLLLCTWQSIRFIYWGDLFSCSFFIFIFYVLLSIGVSFTFHFLPNHH